MYKRNDIIEVEISYAQTYQDDELPIWILDISDEEGNNFVYETDLGSDSYIRQYVERELCNNSLHLVGMTFKARIAEVLDDGHYLVIYPLIK